MASTSKDSAQTEQREEEGQFTASSRNSAQIEPIEEEGQFSEKHFTHVFSEGEEDYDDYTEKYVKEFPELDFTNEQLKEAVSKLIQKDYKQYVTLRDQYLQQYR